MPCPARLPWRGPSRAEALYTHNCSSWMSDATLLAPVESSGL
jgi:hypothetical protein